MNPFLAIFIRVSAAALLMFSGAKLLSIAAPTAILFTSDPVIGISYRALFAYAGVLEGVLAMFLWRYWRRFPTECLWALLSFCTSIWIYRYAQFSMQSAAPCPCLGRVTDHLGISPNTASQIALSALLFMSTGTAIALTYLHCKPSRRPIPKNIAAAILTWGLISPSHTVAADDVGVAKDSVFRCEGRISWARIKTPSLELPERENAFTVTIAGCNYTIDERLDRNGITSHSFTYDSTNWYLIVSYDFSNTSNWVTTPNRPKLNPNKKLKQPKLNTSTTVSPNIENILPSSGSIVPIWLAFGGACRFRDITDERITPIYFMNSGQLHPQQRMPAKWELDSNGFSLQRYTDYWDDSLFPKRSRCSGLTNIAFVVTSWTNIHSFRLPMAFRFLRYFFSPDTDPQYYLSMDASVVVHRVEAIGTHDSVLPRWPTKTHVIHHPTTDLKYFQQPQAYEAEAGRLKSQVEVDAKAAMKDARSKIREVSKPSRKLPLLIVCLASVPVIFLFRVWRKGRS